MVRHHAELWGIHAGLDFKPIDGVALKLCIWFYLRFITSGIGLADHAYRDIPVTRRRARNKFAGPRWNMKPYRADIVSSEYSRSAPQSQHT